MFHTLPGRPRNGMGWTLDAQQITVFFILFILLNILYTDELHTEQLSFELFLIMS